MGGRDGTAHGLAAGVLPKKQDWEGTGREVVLVVFLWREGGGGAKWIR